MYNYIKKRIERNLIEEIHILNADDLEYVGHYMISMIEGERLIHHGLNSDGRPVGYTVDSFSSDGNIVGEYSVDKDYFSDYSVGNSKNYDKIQKDINHALSFSNPKKIYLLSSQDEIPSFRKHFYETDIFLKNKDKIFIYDAREIAKIIYEQSKESADAADFYRGFFPNFAQEFDNYEYYGKVPSSCENFFVDEEIIKKIDKHFSSGKKICVLHGVSGSGKTQTAIEYIHHKKTEFQNFIWITGDDLKRGTTLSSIQRTRGGMPINITGMFNYSKTILVIDSLEREVSENDFAELAMGFEKDGIVLVTSQIAMKRDFYLQMPELTEEVALKILQEPDADNPLAKELISKCKGFPLILATARNMIEFENIDRMELYGEILQNPDEISGTDGKSIVKKILSKLDEKTLGNLIKIANTDCTMFDIDFLRKFSSTLACHKLQQLSILMSTNIPGIVKFHDLICDALHEANFNNTIISELEEYIAGKAGEMTPSILRQIYLSRDLIEIYKEEKREIDWLTYALFQVEGEDKNNLVEEICTQKFEKGMSLCAVKCLIEAKELKGYTIKGKEQSKQYFENNIIEYEEALMLYENEDIKAEILHHLGKAYRRHGDYEKSYESFMKLLEIKSCWHATYGQIITLGTMKVSDAIKDAGKKYMRLLLDDILSDASKVPLRVSLSTIAKLRSYRDIVNEIIDTEEKVELLCQVVVSAALEDIGQFFEGFVSISSIFSYHYMDNCVLLAESVPDMIMVKPDMVDKQQWLNACEALANIATVAKTQGKEELYEMLIDKSVEFADAVGKKGKLNGYEVRAVAKTYNIKGDYNNALEIIEKIPSDKREHWVLYRQAEAEMNLNKEKSVNTAKAALRLLEMDIKNIDRKPSYLHLLSKSYSAIDDIENAKLTIQQAIDVCEDKKYKEELIDYSRKIVS